MDKLHYYVQKIVAPVENLTPLCMVDLLYKYDYSHTILVGVASTLYPSDTAIKELVYIHNAHTYNSIMQLLQYVVDNKPMCDTVRTLLGCFKTTLANIVKLDKMTELCNQILQGPDVDLIEQIPRVLDADLDVATLHYVVNSVESTYHTHTYIVQQLLKKENGEKYLNKYSDAVYESYIHQTRYIIQLVEENKVDKDFMVKFMTDMKELVYNRVLYDIECTALHNTGLIHASRVDKGT